mmetsp:Transcript_2014/g.6478  ORF Transcript_2014/g.6478 Transcript_2014/m.6478 type:complete len:309 (-) Transcript_2014:103-1029(-)
MVSALAPDVAAGGGYYRVLGVTRNAPAEDVRRAYKRLALLHHPDKHPPERRAEAEEAFKQVSEAFQVLGHAERRELYDRSCRGAAEGGGEASGGIGRPGLARVWLTGGAPWFGRAGEPFEDPFVLFARLFPDLLSPQTWVPRTQEEQARRERRECLEAHLDEQVRREREHRVQLARVTQGAMEVLVTSLLEEECMHMQDDLALEPPLESQGNSGGGAGGGLALDTAGAEDLDWDPFADPADAAPAKVRTSPAAAAALPWPSSSVCCEQKSVRGCPELRGGAARGAGCFAADCLARRRPRWTQRCHVQL